MRESLPVTVIFFNCNFKCLLTACKTALLQYNIKGRKSPRKRRQILSYNFICHLIKLIRFLFTFCTLNWVPRISDNHFASAQEKVCVSQNISTRLFCRKAEIYCWIGCLLIPKDFQNGSCRFNLFTGKRAFGINISGKVYGIMPCGKQQLIPIIRRRCLFLTTKINNWKFTILTYVQLWQLLGAPSFVIRYMQWGLIELNNWWWNEEFYELKAHL